MAAAKTHVQAVRAEAGSDVKSVAKALDLLCCFTTERPEWGVTELADYLGLYKSAVHRLLITFVRLRFIEQTSSRRYRLGIRTAELGNMFQRNDQLVRVAERGLRVLAEEMKVITHLSKLDGRDTVELLRFDGMVERHSSGRSAVRREAHATAKGKIFLAYVPNLFESYVCQRRFLKKYTPMTIETPESLRAELDRIRRQGYAVDNEESRGGLRCIAVPVCLPSGTLVAALSISAQTKHLSIDDVPLCVPRLVHLARSIGCDLHRRPA